MPQQVNRVQATTAQFFIRMLEETNSVPEDRKEEQIKQLEAILEKYQKTNAANLVSEVESFLFNVERAGKPVEYGHTPDSSKVTKLKGQVAKILGTETE